ncbi:MAG TPA: PH domain-containing protein [Actinomycetota bacterium]|nr:PH domain-containing protein [Actinomycetota bacterium]
MPFPRRLLVPNEELVLEIRPHWIALVMPAIVTILIVVGYGFAIGYAPDDGSGRTALVWGATAVALFLLILFPVRKFIAWATSWFVVTSDRVIHREGWIAKRSMEIPLEAINDVRFHQGVFERMIGAGDLIISSASEFGREVFGDIRNPEEVQRTIYHQGELNKQRMYLGRDERSPQPAQRSSAPAMPPAAPSTTGELERLAELRDRGVLTEAEFQIQKKKILGQ